MEASNTKQEIRYAKACNPCRRKKSRCDGRRPVCSSCNAFDEACGFNDVVKSKRRRANHGYIQELESRLKDLEGQLQSERSNKGSSPAHSNGIEDAGQSPRPSINREDEQHQPIADSIPKEEHRQTQEDSNTSYLVTNPDGDMRFFGPSSGFSCISGPGARWIEHRTRNRNWGISAQRILHHSQLTNWVPRPLQDDFSRRQSRRLPSKAETVALVNDFFEHTNTAFPLFEREGFFRRLEKQYSWHPDDNPAWWASLNIVLAFSERRKVDLDPEYGDGRITALGYVKNALNVVIELFLRKTELLAVQAIVALALYFQDTPNPQPLFMFSAAALRMAQSIGLHKSASFGLTESQIEERRNTFWIAFILDADICQRTGRPPVQDAHDYDTELPSEAPANGKGILALSNGIVRLSFFHILSRFALLQRKVYDRIYTAQGLKRHSIELLQDITACEKELQEWKMSIPPEYQPRRNFIAPSEPMLSHVLRLHFAFHSCQAKLHRMFTVSGRSMSMNDNNNHHSEAEAEPSGSTATVIGDISIAERCKKSTSAALEAARACIELLEQGKSFGSTFAWSFLYFPAAAVPTLVSHLLVDPFHDQAQSDLEKIHQVVQFVERLAAEEEGTYADYILDLCQSFEAAAKQMRQGPVDSHGQSSDTLDHQPVLANAGNNSNNIGQANFWNPGFDAAMQFQGMESLDDAGGQSGLPWNWQDMATGMPSFLGADPFSGLYMSDLYCSNVEYALI